MNEIRVPAKVVKYWTEVAPEAFVPDALFCGLDDGRVYVSVKVDIAPPGQPPRQWALHTPAMTDR